MTYREQFVYLFAGALVLILAACSVQAQWPALNSNVRGSSMQEDGLPPAVLEAQGWLAEMLGVAVEEVAILESEQVDWPDSCLGLGGPDESCAQVITPGWRAIFDVGGQGYEVRTDETASVIRLADEMDESPGADGLEDSPQNGLDNGLDNGLANTQWRLVSFGPRGAETPVIEGSSITLEFGADGSVGGSGGCNSYGGEYEAVDGMISFSNIISTLMACIDEAITEQEGRYFEALNVADGFSLEGDRLAITYGGGQGVLNFERS